MKQILNVRFFALIFALFCNSLCPASAQGLRSDDPYFAFKFDDGKALDAMFIYDSTNKNIKTNKSLRVTSGTEAFGAAKVSRLFEMAMAYNDFWDLYYTFDESLGDLRRCTFNDYSFFCKTNELDIPFVVRRAVPPEMVSAEKRKTKSRFPHISKGSLASYGVGAGDVTKTLIVSNVLLKDIHSSLIWDSASPFPSFEYTVIDDIPQKVPTSRFKGVLPYLENEIAIVTNDIFSDKLPLSSFPDNMLKTFYAKLDSIPTLNGIKYGKLYRDAGLLSFTSSVPGIVKDVCDLKVLSKYGTKRFDYNKSCAEAWLECIFDTTLKKVDPSYKYVDRISLSLGSYSPIRTDPKEMIIFLSEDGSHYELTITESSLDISFDNPFNKNNVVTNAQSDALCVVNKNIDIRQGLDVLAGCEGVLEIDTDMIKGMLSRSGTEYIISGYFSGGGWNLVPMSIDDGRIEEENAIFASYVRMTNHHLLAYAKLGGNASYSEMSHSAADMSWEIDHAGLPEWVHQSGMVKDMRIYSLGYSDGNCMSKTLSGTSNSTYVALSASGAFNGGNVNFWQKIYDVHDDECNFANDIIRKNSGIDLKKGSFNYLPFKDDILRRYSKVPISNEGELLALSLGGSGSSAFYLSDDGRLFIDNEEFTNEKFTQNVGMGFSLPWSSGNLEFHQNVNSDNFLRTRFRFNSLNISD